MTGLHRASLVVVALIGMWAAVLLGPTAAGAAQPSNAVVTITDSPDPVNSGGNIRYSIAGKNDGPERTCPLPPMNCSDRPTLEAEIPAGATFVSCRTTATFVTDPAAVLCAVSGSIVTAQYQTVPAHESVTMILTVKAPVVTAQTTISLRGKFSGESMHMDERSQVTTVLAPSTRLLMSPSGRTVLIACGYTIDPAMFGADTDATLLDGMVCTNGSGLTLTASGRTFNLGVNKIVSTVRVTGNAGIIVGPNAPNITIKGGGTGGTRGIEAFEYCVKDLGGNTGLIVTDLRCFRPKAAGILALSNEVLIRSSKIDRATPDAFLEVPGGGIGIQAGGDNVHVKDTIVVGSAKIGFWAYGVDADGSGRVATYDGTPTTSRIENNFGVGVLLSGGPHQIKDTKVQGDDAVTGTSMDGIVVAGTALGANLDGVVIKKHGGHAIWVEAGAADTVIARTSVEDIGGSGYMIDAPTTLNGNSAALVAGDGFVINASSTLTSNNVEQCAGTAFVVNAAATVDGNSAVDNGGYGFVTPNSSLAALGPDWTIEAVADFNGDGKADILWRHSSGIFYIWLMDGTTIIGSGSPSGPGLDWTFKKVGDFNGDGKADILLQHSSGVVYVWLMDGTTIIGSGSPSGLTSDWVIQDVGDFNGDGKADILLQHSSGIFYIWFIDSTTIISHGSPSGASPEWVFQSVGDFNGDGKADILLRHTSGIFYTWLLDGTTIIGHGSPSGAGSEWTFQHLADFNGDGKADILLRNSSGLPYIWLMNGTSIIGDGSPASLANVWTIEGVGDFDGDGKADIFWRNTSGSLSTWFMNGTRLLSASGVTRFLSNTAESNTLGGFKVSGRGNVLIGNAAKGNGGFGFDITVTGSGNALDTNAAERSSVSEFTISPNNIDNHGNRANGKAFSFSAAGGAFQ